MQCFYYTMKNNQYFDLLNKILDWGRPQQNKKGDIIYLLNQTLSLDVKEVKTLFTKYKVAKKKLGDELELYLEGETDINKYHDKNITWWDYIGEKFVNSYPTYYKKVPGLIKKINEQKRPSKNYVFYNGETDVKSSQQPCISLMQFQVPNNELHMSIYQRSADSNLGLPSDIYQAYLLSKKIDAPLKNITFFIGNAHIYKNNIDETKKMLEGRPYKFNLNA